MQKPSRFFLFFLISSLFFAIFPDFLPLFPNFWQTFCCQGALCPLDPPVATPLHPGHLKVQETQLNYAVAHFGKWIPLHHVLFWSCDESRQLNMQTQAFTGEFS